MSQGHETVTDVAQVPAYGHRRPDTTFNRQRASSGSFRPNVASKLRSTVRSSAEMHEVG